jgi:flagellar assembly factor FliW
MHSIPPSDPAVLSDSAIVFPTGLVGCESWKRFVLLVDDEEELPVAVLRCLDDPEVELMVTDPYFALPEYRVHLSEADRAFMQLAEGEQPQLFCTLSVDQDGSVTANLLGPLAINARARRGKQLVLADSPYSTRHPVACVSATDTASHEGGSCSS